LVHIVHFIAIIFTFHFFSGKFFFIFILSVILFFDDFHILLLLLLHIRIDTLYHTIWIILHALYWLLVWHLITRYFLLQTLWTKSLMTRCTKWSDLLSSSNFWWLHLSELIVSKITLRCFWGQYGTLFPSSLTSKLTYRPVISSCIISGKRLWTSLSSISSIERTTIRIRTHQSCFGSTNAMKKIRITTESIAILPDHLA